MAEFDAPRTAYVRVGGSWKQVDLIDSGVSQMRVGGSWKNITEAYVKVNGVWQQVLNGTNPPAPTITTARHWYGNYELSWTNPTGTWKIEVKRRLHSADPGVEGNFTTLVAQTTNLVTSLSDSVPAGTLGDGKYNAVNGSRTNVQGARYAYRIRVWDNFGHVSTVSHSMDRGRVPSPLFVRATNSRTFRGSAFRTDITNRAYQGYTTTGLNYGHYWYGGDASGTNNKGIVAECFGGEIYTANGPTVYAPAELTAAEFMACRDAGGIGDGSGTVKITMWTHNQLALVAGTNGWSNNATNVDAGTGQNRETQTWQSIGTTNGNAIITGTAAKGIVMYNSSTTVESYDTSRHYFIGYGYDEPRNGASAGNGTTTGEWPGMLRFTHSG